ncbi:hypothetical protein GCM10020229_71210 [Kitasatospora albolonga]|uniref:hypothetical protein n=1 Tax=Kitasatospora albolonga TaxID=68173 RepID=UPI0031ED4A77
MSDGAVGGDNRTARRIRLFKNTTCQGYATAVIEPGYSWHDRSSVYLSFATV